MRLRCWSRPVLVLSALALLAGCAADRARPPALDAHSRATVLYQQGQYDRAAELWLQAASLQGPNAAYWRLLAAAALIHHGSAAQADQLLQELDPAALAMEERALHALLRARLLLRAGRVAAARQHLPGRQDLPPAWRADFDRLAQRIDERAADPAARAVTALAEALASGTDRQARERFHELASLPGPSLQRLAATAPEHRARSLALLARVARQAALRPRQSDAYITAWRFAERPAVNPSRARALVDDFTSYWDYPQRLAVLLPESGRLRGAATALRNGLMTAWLQLPGVVRPELLLFDSGASAAAAAEAYMQAMEANADWIVGPLDRAAVEAVVSVPGRTAPVLALNQRRAAGQGATTPTSDAFFFALPPEQEARASAALALDARCRRALLLASDDTQGRQLARVFDQHFGRNGGHIDTRRFFTADASGYEALVGAALHIDRSRGRKEALESLLGVPIAFEPQPRDDLDCVLLAASPRQARSIMPQFDFLGVSELPVYATQHAYSGRPDPRADSDLDGLRLPISPWLANAGPVRPVLSHARGWFSELDNRVLAELFGLGLDTMRLLPYLQLLRGDTTLSMPGASGELSVSDHGALLRELAPARFAAGRLTLESG